MELPVFPYHPDPLASGSIRPSGADCQCCGQARGYIYASSPYCEAELEDAICPWCIADGSAWRRFRAVFTDDTLMPRGLPASVVAEITQRTPGFSGWQQEHWLGCCDDAAVFVAPAGFDEIEARHPHAKPALIDYMKTQLGLNEDGAAALYRSLHKDRGPTAYIFQCRHCTNQPAYIDRP
ncbi:MAG TPA: CbrC family protein [Rhizomicrobium sp.]|nr:CbrC family protein [Rhizomicrobium sp.]